MDGLLNMKVFCAVVESRGFTSAGRQLGMSTAMVSKHVMHLEGRLGTRLLNRTSRSLSLTESGALYFARLRQTLHDLEETEALVTSAAVVPRGVLRISAPVWLANPIFVAIVADYQARYPEVQLDIDLSGRLVDLVEEGYDLALRAARTLGDSLVARPIASLQFLVVGAPAYLERAGRPRTVLELADHKMLMYSIVDLSNGLSFTGPAGVETVKLTPVLQSTNESLLRLAALQGMGLAVLPTWLIAQDLEEGLLEPLLTAYRFFDAQLIGVYPSRKYLSSKVRTFLDFLSQDARLR